MIDANGLTKRYDGVTAVDGVSLSVEQGAVFGFLGPNGAGKTTTIELLTAMTEPTAGTATVAGIDVTDRDALKSHIGYLPDEPPLYDAFTAREQLEYVAVLRDMDADAANRRIDRLLARVDLAADADRRIETYSTGMRKKVGLLQSLLHRPEVLFLDEPTSGLDPRAARDVVDLVDDLADDGTTVFLSTHVLPVAEELADVVGVLHDGRLVAEGPPTELRERASGDGGGSLEAVFLEVTGNEDAVANREDPADDRPNRIKSSDAGGSPTHDDRRQSRDHQ
jgi:ABC-2 type transport system ATP-binding protein